MDVSTAQQDFPRVNLVDLPRGEKPRHDLKGFRVLLDSKSGENHERFPKIEIDIGRGKTSTAIPQIQGR